MTNSIAGRKLSGEVVRKNILKINEIVAYTPARYLIL